MISDFIANEITKIRNAVAAEHTTVTLFTNKVILGILKILLDNGFISGYKVNTNDKHISTADVELKYNPTSAIVEIKRVSTPGHRIYVSSDNLPRIYNGLWQIRKQKEIISAGRLYVQCFKKAIHHARHIKTFISKHVNVKVLYFSSEHVFT